MPSSSSAWRTASRPPPPSRACASALGQLDGWTDRRPGRRPGGGAVEKPPVPGVSAGSPGWGPAGTHSCVVHISCNPPEIKEAKEYFLKSLKPKAWCQDFFSCATLCHKPQLAWPGHAGCCPRCPWSHLGSYQTGGYTQLRYSRRPAQSLTALGRWLFPAWKPFLCTKPRPACSPAMASLLPPDLAQELHPQTRSSGPLQ